MTGNDADFAGYVTARWPTLLRTVVLIGCPRSDAEAVVETGLAHCYLAWDRTRHVDDMDVHVYQEVLRAWHHHPIRSHPPDEPEPIWPVLADDEHDDQAMLRHAVETELVALEPQRRTAAALTLVADLSGRQVVDVLEPPGGVPPERAPRLVVDHLREASEAIEVLAAPYDRIVGRARAERRRRRRTTVLWVLGLVALAAIAVAVSLLTGGEDSPPPPDTTVVVSSNPVDIAWYADGRLHLERVVVEVPPLAEIAELDGGVVYADITGEVVFVSRDGARTHLGQQAVGGALAVSNATGWASWADISGDQPTIVVYDVDREALVGVLTLPYDEPDPTGPPDPTLIAIQQDAVYFAHDGLSYRWSAPDGPARRLERPGLLDLEASARAYQDGSAIDLVQSFFQVSFRRPGFGVTLSQGGTYALSRETRREGPFSPLLYDVRTGRRLSTGVRPDETVVDAAFGHNQTAVYFVGAPSDRALVLRSCVLGTDVCENLVPVPPSEDLPVLAH